MRLKCVDQLLDGFAVADDSVRVGAANEQPVSGFDVPHLARKHERRAARRLLDDHVGSAWHGEKKRARAQLTKLGTLVPSFESTIVSGRSREEKPVREWPEMEHPYEVVQEAAQKRLGGREHRLRDCANAMACAGEADKINDRTEINRCCEDAVLFEGPVVERIAQLEQKLAGKPLM